jgi:hypothetical protein
VGTPNVFNPLYWWICIFHNLGLETSLGRKKPKSQGVVFKIVDKQNEFICQEPKTFNRAIKYFK